MDQDMEFLSALMDGELAAADAERALAALAGADAQAQWRAWQAIGEALRAGGEPGPGCAERLAARLGADIPASSAEALP
jgi:sigma-E factor negative regulatory protein RseA